MADRPRGLDVLTKLFNAEIRRDAEKRRENNQKNSLRLSAISAFSAFELVSLLGILILAVILRFGWSGVSSFAWDEANLSLDALRTIRGGDIALAGQPSSVAIPFFPASVYVFAIPYAVSTDPLIAVGFVSALSVLTVLGVWALGRAMFGVPAGLAAALFLTANPYAVLYGRSIWQPNLLPPMALAWLAAGFFSLRNLTPRPPLHVERGRATAIAVCVFLGGFVVQVHFAGIPLVIGTLVLFVRGRWWKNGRAVLIGGIAAALFVVPYVVFLAQNPAILERYGAVLGGETRYDLTGFENAAKLALGYGWGFLGGGEGDPRAQTTLTAALAGVLLLLGLGQLINAKTQRRKDAKQEKSNFSFVPLRLRAFALSFNSELILLALLISPLFFIRHSTPVLPHYQLVALPAIAITVGASAALIRRRVWTAVIMMVLLILAVWWTNELVTMFNRVAVERPLNSALSSILRESRDAAYGVETPVIMFTHGDNPEIDGEVAVFETLLWDRPHRVVNGDVLLILPPEPTTLLATLAPFQAWEELQASDLALDVQEFPRRLGALPFVATHYDGSTFPAGFTEVEPVAFTDGTTFIGWRTRRVGERLRISTLWRADDTIPYGIVQQFHHLRRADEDTPEPLAVSDVPLSLHTWRNGDLVIAMADFFDLSAGEYTIDIGHYTLPDVARIPRADGGDSVRLGTFSAD